VQVLLERIGIWRGDLESLSKWVAYQFRRQHLERDGLGAIVAALHEGAIDTASASAHLQVSYYQALIRRMFKDHPELAEFDGRSYSQWIDEFRRLDMARIDLARVEVAQAHYESIPRDSSLGEMAVIRREIEKKRRHKSIRQLIKEAGTAIQAIKPVFMMSPISVAQFLDPGIVTFDLMVIDEASQVSPVDAFGAMIRAKQIVVLGDDKQLPPTSFFAKLLDDDASDGGDADSNPADLQSILHLCRSAGVPQRTLRWHYRSRHHSLIAVSNHEFYEDKLYVVPSPTTVSAATGLVFKFVPDGVFDRGASATNRIEARAIAQAIIAHARSTPQKSLGIGTFSVAQRDVIRDELELLRRAEPTLESFFSKGCADPFFIKNLENIQGDERDVIFISVGYARDESGYMAMNFGPLSNDGGERRLNVLISRAREQCVVFSSITADDIDLQRARSRGAAAFKSFLRYAQTGNLDVHAAAARELDSDFEQQVANSLISFGFDVHHQVGTAGFFLDLAVVDPKRPGRYILGIECDGATYHSSRSARDRDRLREKVLLDRGWRIHRIWSTDWFHRPDEQLKRVHEAIEKAQVEADSDEDSLRESVMNSPSRPIATMATSVATEIERTETAPSTHGQVDWVIPYHEAQLSVPCDTAIHETDVQILCEVISRVVELEGPIHTEEVARRLTSLWGLQRTGNRIVEATNRAIECLLRARKLQAESHFLDVPGRSPTRVRSRESVSSSSLRKPETIPPAELRQAIRYLVNAHVGISGEELATNVIRAFGFKATSEKLRACVDETLNQLLTAKEVQERDQKLYPLDSQVTVS
jgi:very-short-patch-repair endonuclease